MKTRLFSTAIATSLVIAFAAGPVAHAEGQNKQTLCHKGLSTITVADPAVYNAHLQHGDTPGPCPVNPNAGPVAQKPGAAASFVICPSDDSDNTQGNAVDVTGIGRVEKNRVSCD